MYIRFESGLFNREKILWILKIDFLATFFKVHPIFIDRLHIIQVGAIFFIMTPYAAGYGTISQICLEADLNVMGSPWSQVVIQYSDQLISHLTYGQVSTYKCHIPLSPIQKNKINIKIKKESKKFKQCSICYSRYTGPCKKTGRSSSIF